VAVGERSYAVAPARRKAKALFQNLNVRFATIPSTNSLFRSHPKGAHRTVTLLRNKYVVPLNGRGVVKSVAGFLRTGCDFLPTS